MNTALALDAGDILLCEKTEIGENETAGELASRLSALSAPLILRAVTLLKQGGYTLKKQSEEGVRILVMVTTTSW